MNLNEKLTQRTLQDFIKYDLLRIKNNQYYEKTLMEILLWPSRGSPNGNHIQNGMARLVNGILSYPAGREYVGSTSIVNHLIWGGENEVFKVEPSRQFIDSGTAGMLVAALMKLSHVPWQRKDMLNKGILSWTLNHLEDIEYSGTVFQIKYTLGLLNSLLRLPEAVEELTRRPSQVLVLLARYLRKEKAEWFFTVKCILVKLFKQKHFRQAAKEMNFETLLRRLINPLDFRGKKEIDFIILYLNDSGNITQLPCSASSFEVEEPIIFDPEIEADDGIVDLPGLEGELLLEEQFAKYRIVYQLSVGEEERDSGEIKKEPANHPEVTRIFQEPGIKTVEELETKEEPQKEQVGEGTKEEPRREDEAPEIPVGETKDEEVKVELLTKEVTEKLKLKDSYEDDNDVVIGQLEEDEQEEGAVDKGYPIHTVQITPPSDSDDTPDRHFPDALSISSLSSLDDPTPREPKRWVDFPVKGAKPM